MRGAGIVVFNTPGANANGVKELILIAQDTSRYGIDLYGKRRLSEPCSGSCDKIRRLPLDSITTSILTRWMKT